MTLHPCFQPASPQLPIPTPLHLVNQIMCESQNDRYCPGITELEYRKVSSPINQASSGWPTLTAWVMKTACWTAPIAIITAVITRMSLSPVNQVYMCVCCLFVIQLCVCYQSVIQFFILFIVVHILCVG